MSETANEIIESFKMPEPPQLNWKFEELKGALEENLAPYKNLVVTEETLSDCKAKQKEIAGWRNRIDEFRKDVKRQYQEPLKVFESQCKELTAIINDAEAPINKGIKAFDDRRRAEKRETAENLIKELAAEYSLDTRFAGLIELKSKYCNLTAREADVRADIEAQCMVLKAKQDERTRMLNIIKSAVERENEDIKAKMNPDSYTSLIDRIDLDEILDRIKLRAKEIRQAERQAESKPDEPKPQPKDIPTQDMPSEAVKQAESDEHIYQVTYIVTGTKAVQKSVSEFLKGCHINDYVEQQIKIK